LVARRVPASDPALRMLARYIGLGQRDLIAADAALQNAFADHVCDLVALALGATRDASELARSRGLPAARLLAMKDDIRKNCHRPDLSVHVIAGGYGVSARYVQRLFEESGCTFTQYITEQRLLAAYKALRQDTFSDVPISTIAYDCGFSDISHFNRVFRRQFGCTPTEARNTES
jgi:AraC-like DNA-binding protein